MVSNSSLFTPPLLRTHSFVFFAVHETCRIYLSPFISKASRCVSSFFLSVQLSQPYVATGHTSASYFRWNQGTRTYPPAPVVHSEWVMILAVCNASVRLSVGLSRGGASSLAGCCSGRQGNRWWQRPHRQNPARRLLCSHSRWARSTARPPCIHRSSSTTGMHARRGHVATVIAWLRSAHLIPVPGTRTTRYRSFICRGLMHYQPVKIKINFPPL